MITLNQLKAATIDILNSERPIFNPDLDAAHDDIVEAIIAQAEWTEKLEDYEDESTIDLDGHGYDTYAEYEKDLDQTRVDEWREEVYSACEHVGIDAGEFMSDLVYTADIMQYLADNFCEVEEVHEQIGSEGSLSEQINLSVAIARHREAEGHVSDLGLLFDDSSALEEALGL